MPDREKVIKGLEAHGCGESMWRICNICPYDKEECVKDRCRDNLLADAYALLKEREAVRPVFDDSRNDVIGTFHCGACHSMLGFIHPLYCPHCGRKVKWE